MFSTTAFQKQNEDVTWQPNLREFVLLEMLLDKAGTEIAYYLWTDVHLCL